MDKESHFNVGLKANLHGQLEDLTDSMNRSTQTYTAPEYLRTGPDYDLYLARGNGRNRMPSIFPFHLPAGGPLDPRDEDHDPQWLFRERTRDEPLGISSYPASLHFHNQIQLMDSDTSRNTRPRQRAADASPSFESQRNIQVPGGESRLTQAEQIKALNRLKKEIYNPMPKWLTMRPNLYYRNSPITSSRQAEKENHEDGKRCAICLDDFEPKQVVTVTPCKHMFHEECIVPWVKSQGQCPVCRFAVCERFRDSAAPSGNMRPNADSAAPSGNTRSNADSAAFDLITITRTVGEAFVSEDARQFLV